MFRARFSHLQLKIVSGFLLSVMLVFLLPSFSFAIPAFARKYDLSCTSCHTKPPRLNAFGEAFHMAGFQIPTVKEGETRKKRVIGHIVSETDFLNIFALRANGNMVESLTFPREVDLYLAGTVTDEISYFFELEHDNGLVKGTGGGLFEETSEFGIGKEFFFMLDSRLLFERLFSGNEGTMPEMAHGSGEKDHGMIMGPMIMVGKIDPSTNFSYPTNRQMILNVPGHVDSGVIERFGLTPYAFASKFFGIETAEGSPIEVTKEVLYNTTGDYGIDLHMMIDDVLIQAGLIQGLPSGTRDANQKKDPYLMVRLNFGQKAYTSGSLSGLVYWGNETARVDTRRVDWFRYGFSGNLKYHYLDLYGAMIWDTIRDFPMGISGPFDRTAQGFTLEGDYLAADRWLLSLRYDQLDAGGFIDRKTDGKTLTAQARFYMRDHFSFYLRDSYNVEGVSANALRNFQNFVELGADFAF